MNGFSRICLVMIALCRAAAQLLLFAILFVWYVSELEGAVYIMAPIV